MEGPDRISLLYSPFGAYVKFIHNVYILYFNTLYTSTTPVVLLTPYTACTSNELVPSLISIHLSIHPSFLPSPPSHDAARRTLVGDRWLRFPGFF